MKFTLEWMEWTVPTAVFCITIILTVLGKGVGKSLFVFVRVFGVENTKTGFWVSFGIQTTYLEVWALGFFHVGISGG